MALIEVLITGVGASVAEATLKLWLKDNEIAAAAGGSVAEILLKKIPDLFGRNKTQRTFEQIRDLSADSIQRMLKKEAEGIHDDRLKIIANAAGATLRNTPIDIELLVGHNLDKDNLVEYFLERTGAQGGNPALAGKDPNNKAFQDEEQQIYRRILSHASQLIVDMSSTFPRFDVQVTSELLQRTESLAEQVIDGMNRVVVEQSDAFEADYRNACVRRWDHLELFGVDLSETNKRYNLSVAYVTLMVQRLASDPDSADIKEQDKDDEIRDSMTADEALAMFDRLFVRGPAGSGKTTLLQWFAVFAAARRLEGHLAPLNGCVPFLIKLRNYSDDWLPAPEDFVKEASTAIAGNMPVGWVHQKLKGGDAIVLVDGLDEVAENRRADVRSWLNDLTESFPDSRFLITSRPHAAEEGWLDADQFVDAELQEMGHGDVHEFIEHWHAAVAETIRDEDEKPILADLAESLKSKLSKNTAIFRLATSPLLCALLCALHRQRVQNLPSDRIELYQLCIEMFMRRDEERKIDASDYIELTNRQKESLLQDFAWWMIRNEKTTATPDETVDCFQRHFNRLTHAPAGGDGEAVKKLFLQRICIIRQLAHQKIDFPHRTFQEYLAAKAAAEEDDLGVLVKNAHDDQWREVVILATGLLSPKRASALMMDLLERGDSAPEFHSLYLVAVAALDLLVAGDEDSTLKTAVGERLDKIVPPKNLTAATQLAIAGDLVVPHLRYRKMRAAEAAASVRTLALIGGEAAHRELEKYAKDSREGVKRSCRQALRFGRDPDACAEIVFGNSTDLQFLDLSGTLVSDLSCLASLTKLTSLTLGGAQFPDINSLACLTKLPNLTTLNLQNPSISDITGLASRTNLTSLNLSGTRVSDVSSLASLTNLTSLDLSDTKVSDASSLANLTNLTSLDLSGTQVSDVSSLANLTKLTSLDLSGTQVSDVSSLASLINLTSLNLNGTKVSDVSSLASLINLTSLDLFGTQVSDVSSLASLINLTSLNLFGTQVSDVSSLVSLINLTSLDLSLTQVSDVSSLASLINLTSLNLIGTKVSDVSSLASLFNLTSLNLIGTKVSDVSSLRSIQRLRIYGGGLK